MPRPSKKEAAAQKNWQSAVQSIKAGTKRALEIITPRKKKRKIVAEKENVRDFTSYFCLHNIYLGGGDYP
jgi:hypothetical protein